MSVDIQTSKKFVVGSSLLCANIVDWWITSFVGLFWMYVLFVLLALIGHDGCCCSNFGLFGVQQFSTLTIWMVD